jgi:hypothetical protein
MRLATALSAFGMTAAMIMLAAPAHADVDTDYANQLAAARDFTLKSDSLASRAVGPLQDGWCLRH